jgi:hypothetical protein
MTGTDKARACTVCGRQVHDLWALTTSEVERLLDRRDERLCIRFSRGPDGKIITADRLPKYSPQRRSFAGLSVAALAAFIGASQPRVAPASTLAARSSDGRQAATPGTQVANARDGHLSGIIHDQSGTVLISDAKVWALSEGTGEEFSTQSGEDGRFSLIVPKGNYTVGVSSPGFRPYSVSGVKVKPGKNSKLDVTIQLPILGESISVYPDAPRHSIQSPRKSRR